ncbi:hypothetical protein ACWKWJ_15800 [Sphingopyxis terrae subsp. ummariensis]
MSVATLAQTLTSKRDADTMQLFGELGYGRPRCAGGRGLHHRGRQLRPDRHADPEEFGRDRSGLRLQRGQFPDRRRLQRHAGRRSQHPWHTRDRTDRLLIILPRSQAECWRGRSKMLRPLRRFGTARGAFRTWGQAPSAALRRRARGS